MQSIRLLLILFALNFAAALRTEAQVESVNAVGYVNLAIPPGFSLLSVPLARTREVFLDPYEAVFGNLPDGFSLYFLRDGKFEIIETGRFPGPSEIAGPLPDEMQPGGGFFVLNPTASQVTLTFVGELRQGFITNNLPAGLSVRSIPVPHQTSPLTYNFPGEDGDQLYILDSTRQRFNVFTFDDLVGGWLPPLPSLRVGEAFYIRKNRPAQWVFRFSVNGS